MCYHRKYHHLNYMAVKLYNVEAHDLKPWNLIATAKTSQLQKLIKFNYSFGEDFLFCCIYLGTVFARIPISANKNCWKHAMTTNMIPE